MLCGRAAADGTVRANEDHQTCRGNGDGMQAKLTSLACPGTQCDACSRLRTNDLSGDREGIKEEVSKH